jgi:hypothetical protein
LPHESCFERDMEREIFLVGGVGCVECVCAISLPLIYFFSRFVHDIGTCLNPYRFIDIFVLVSSMGVFQNLTCGINANSC